MMFEEELVQRMDRFVHGLLGNEEQSSAVRVISQFEPLLWRRDQVQQLGRQALGWLNVDAQRIDVGAHSDCCDRDSSVMSQRADDASRPHRRSRNALGQRAAGMPELRQELASDDTSGAACSLVRVTSTEIAAEISNTAQVLGPT